MTTIPTSQTAASPTPSSNGGLSIGSTTVDKNMFLKLLVAQMQNQDPMQPKDDSAWMSQMAQFSEVEQVSNLVSSDAKIASSLDTSKTLSLIGRTVSYTDQSGATQQGVVDKVDIAGNSATLDVAGTSGIDAAAVTEVR